MNKKWLLRKNGGEIIGTMDRDEVIIHLESGDCDESDELCSGNGFWFYLKESNLVQKYIYEKNCQDYNFLSKGNGQDQEEIVKKSRLEDNAWPSNQDLEYPDNTVIEENITKPESKKVDKSSDQIDKVPEIEIEEEDIDHQNLVRPITLIDNLKKYLTYFLWVILVLVILKIIDAFILPFSHHFLAFGDTGVETKIIEKESFFLSEVLKKNTFNIK